METTLCVLNYSKSHCQGKPRTNLPGVLCCRHLGQFYGLEMGVLAHETPTSYKVVGPNFRPKPGVIFEKNCVVIPEREFFDKNFWPRHAQMSPEESKYSMNPLIKSFVENVMTNHVTMEKRFQAEIIRNLSKDPRDMNFGPAQMQEYLSQENLANMKTKLFKSEQFVDKLPYDKYINSFMVPNLGVAQDLAANKDALQLLKHTSKLFAFMLTYCYTSDFVSNSNEMRRPQAVMYNVRYVKGIGLVATEQIAQPMFLILDSTSTGDKQHTEEVVSTIDKKMFSQEITPSDIPRSFAVSSVFQGVNPDCYGP